MLKKRLISLPLVALAYVILVGGAPLWLLLGFIVSRVSKWRSMTQMVAFAISFINIEVIALAWLSFNRLVFFDDARRMQANYAAQAWWASTLLKVGGWIYQLTFTVSGEEAIDGPSAILIARHASIGDNVVPMVFFGTPRGTPLRYILKQELTWLPTLGYGGNSLPNLFVDRSGTNTPEAVAGVRSLITTSGPHESVLIYPEGTRFTKAKQAALAAKPDLAPQVERWPDLLPPRLGGVTTLLEANALENLGKDVVMLCHNGFEGAASALDLANGRWVKQTIALHFWRIPFAEIGEDFQAFVFEQWDEMQRQLLRLREQA